MIRPNFGPKSGMSLVEVAIASSLFAFIGIILTTSVDVGVRTHKTVQQSITSMDLLREGASSLRNALRITDDANVTLITLASGDTQITMMEPLTVGGALTWGVYDTKIGVNVADHTQVGWSVIFTVTSQADPSNTNTGLRNDLVRRIVDDTGVTQFQETIVSGLFQGGLPDPGFRVQKSGDLWEVQLQCAGSFSNTKGPSTNMQVRARN